MIVDVAFEAWEVSMIQDAINHELREVPVWVRATIQDFIHTAVMDKVKSMAPETGPCCEGARRVGFKNFSLYTCAFHGRRTTEE